jgi:hypothetical protein
MDAHATMTCARCGERIGAYEPLLWVRPDGVTSVTSRLRLRGEPDDALSGSAYYHEACGAAELGQSPTMP